MVRLLNPRHFCIVNTSTPVLYCVSCIVLEKIIKLSPDFIDAYINLGNIYFDLGQLEKSVNSFKRANKEIWRKNRSFRSWTGAFSGRWYCEGLWFGQRSGWRNG